MESVRSRIEKIVRAAAPRGAAFDVTPAPRPEFGHYSTNIALRLAKEEKKDPMKVAAELMKKIARRAPKGFLAKTDVAPPGFINFWVSEESWRGVFQEILAAGDEYGRSAEGEGRTIIVEYSQPNIAKKMHVGHLRTTVLGDTLANLYGFLGYTVVRWNYLGDWGTQFGKLIAAYKMWGNKKAVQADPIQTLLDLYVRFHDELKYRPELEDAGREEFRKLEAGDKENRKLWEWFKRESLKEFDRVYKILGINFDVEIGESYFEPQLKALVEELLAKKIATRSEGSVLVDLASFDLPPALIQKSDGASLYLTRDIANIRYRVATYAPTEVIYVVGNEQTLHFEQLFRVAGLMKLAPKTKLTHVKYGLVLAESGKKFATREGRVVFLEEIIEKAVRLAYDIVATKNKKLGAATRRAVANAVAVGALKYANLRENRHSDIVFDWDKMLDFSGDSAPYLQYTYSRLMSIVTKAGGVMRADAAHLEGELDYALIRRLAEFPEVVRTAALTYATNHLTSYLYELAVLANKMYEAEPILIDKKTGRRRARLLLVKTTALALAQGLRLMGVKTLKKI